MYISTTTYVFQHLVESKLAVRRHLVKQNDSGNGFDCHTTHEKLHQFHSLKEFNTINRHWLVQSVSRMRQSGLINEWEHLQNWAMMLGNDVPIEIKEIRHESRQWTHDLIGRNKLLTICIILLGSCILGILLLAFEILHT